MSAPKPGADELDAALAALEAIVVWDTCVRDGPELRVLLTDLRATL